MTSSLLARAFPFPQHTCDVTGGRMHYVDEGQGEAILLVHGNPTWSFLYRRFIRPLSATHRVLAPDHLGFGRSDKPVGASYSLAWHVRNFTDFVLQLDLHDLTLVLHDWGGPIGLGFAVEHPQRVRRLVLLNTWAFRMAAGTRLHPLLEAMREPRVGETLILQQNAMVERGLAAGVQRRLSKGVLNAYRAPFPDETSRRAMLAMARDIPLGDTGETSALMGRIQDGLRGLHVPVQIVWGARDPVFPAGTIALWKQHFPAAHVEILANASHFIQEDAPQQVLGRIQQFLAAYPLERGALR